MSLPEFVACRESFRNGDDATKYNAIPAETGVGDSRFFVELLYRVPPIDFNSTPILLQASTWCMCKFANLAWLRARLS